MQLRTPPRGSAAPAARNNLLELCAKIECTESPRGLFVGVQLGPTTELFEAYGYRLDGPSRRRLSSGSKSPRSPHLAWTSTIFVGFHRRTHCPAEDRPGWIPPWDPFGLPWILQFSLLRLSSFFCRTSPLAPSPPRLHLRSPRVSCPVPSRGPPAASPGPTCQLSTSYPLLRSPTNAGRDAALPLDATVRRSSDRKIYNFSLYIVRRMVHRPDERGVPTVLSAGR